MQISQQNDPLATHSVQTVYIWGIYWKTFNYPLVVLRTEITEYITEIIFAKTLPSDWLGPNSVDKISSAADLLFLMLLYNIIVICLF